MVNTNSSSHMRLVTAGVIAVAIGIAIGSFARGRSSGPAGVPAFPPAMTADEMQDAMSEVLLVPGTLERARALDALLDRLDDSNVEGAAAAIDPIVVGVDDCDLISYFQTRAKFDPEGSFRHAMEWPSKHKRGVGIFNATLSWAFDGGAIEARSFVESIEDEDLHGTGIAGLLMGWARSDDVAGATQYLMSIPDDPKQTRNDVLLTYLTATLLGYGGADRLIEWLDSVPDDAPNTFKRAAFRNALLQLASEDPLRAVALRNAHADRDYAGDSLWIIAVSWQRLDPEATFAWLLEQPEGPERTAAITRAMQRWSSREPRAAAAWVLQADLDHVPRVKRLLFGITRQVRELRRQDAGA